MHPKLVIFDLDGTIADTAPGIFDSYRHVAVKLGKKTFTDEELTGMVTNNLTSDLQRIFNLNDAETTEVVKSFLDYYSNIGYLNAQIYPGIKELIIELKKMDIAVAVATMKLEDYARQQIDHWGLTDCFVSINGTSLVTPYTKSDLIDKSLYSAGVRPEDAIMIGDTPGDYQGAAQSGVPFIAVTYGFEFSEDVCLANGITFANNAVDLRKIILS